MSRDDGFPVADMDSAYFDDAKMRDLWQRLHDPDKMARAVVLHAATLLASWRQGERVTVAQAAPLWTNADDELVSDLKAVRLLDRTGRIPVAGWNQWFGVAYKRREVRREIGRAGGLASGKSRSTDGEPTVQGELSSTEPVRPSVPSSPSVRPDRPSAPSPRAKTNGINPEEERRTALLHLSEMFQRGEIDRPTYERERRVLAS